MNVVCKYCKALHFIAERSGGRKDDPVFSTCCQRGVVPLRPIPEPPAILRQLLSHDTRQARSFRNAIRQYNCAFAFTSLGVEIDESVGRGGGPYVFRIKGALHHRMGSLLPDPGGQSRYAQIYIHDSSTAHRQRLDNNPGLDSDVMLDLQNMVEQSNPYAAKFRHACEIARRRGNADNVKVSLHLDKDTDRRRYNLPAANEVAVIIPGDGETGAWDRDIILHLRTPAPDSGEPALQRVSMGSSMYLPLQYPLL
ncbi:hypothetical protein SISSUDRAFT_995113, partial [Sistotremastrum suecicum HHB10207 ss-3]